jgi:large subunit ribosomal protein L25
MEHIAVEARLRESHLTKGERKELRHQGLILGSVYGRGLEAVSVVLRANDLSRVVNAETGMNTLIDLQVDGQRHLVRVSKLETDPITHFPIHVGLQKINAREPQKATIPVELVGEPEAVRTNEGMLEAASPSVDVRAMPESLVSALTLDISDMALNDVRRAGDLTLPKGFELLSDPDAPLVSLRAVQTSAEEIEEPTADAATGDASEQTDETGG